jgi:serine/threonine protein kinase
MNPEQIERVFGRGRLKMVTGEHVEVYREAVARGERRRYTKRFLNTREGDFGEWTEREWRILARLIGHGIACVPDVVQFDRGRGMQLVQTYDAGVTVDQWATLLPVARAGRVFRHVFEDCAHWWALAHHCLRALNEIHPLELVHLDVKGDNVCIPYAPAGFDPHSPELWLRPVFSQLAMIDFAFALISRESLDTPLPIGWQKEYDYQSPRLLAALETGRDGDLRATRELDWRCDMYSLAAMLKRYLPDDGATREAEQAAGWNPERFEAAKALILAIREAHDAELPADPLERPHRALLELSGKRLREEELQLSLERGWTLAREASVSSASPSPLTPLTRLHTVTSLATPIHVARSGRVTAVTVVAPPVSLAAEQDVAAMVASPQAEAPRSRRMRSAAAFAAIIVLAALASSAALWSFGDRLPLRDALQAAVEPLRTTAESAKDAPAPSPSPAPAATPTASAAPGPASAAPAVAPSPPARDAPAASLPKQSIANSAAPRWPIPTLTREGSASPHATSKASRAASVNAPGASSSEQSASSSAFTRASPQMRRSHPSWAALAPPPWSTSSYRGAGPGEPPGAKTQPSAAPASSAQAAAASAPAHATPAPTIADAPRPLANAVTSSAQAMEVAAPVRDRSDTLSLAFAQPSSEARHRSSAGDARTDDDFAVQGRRTLLDAVPQVARQAEPEIARVLAMAASAYRQTQERAVADAARTTRIRGESSLPAAMTSPGEARRLNDQARAAFSSGRNALDAFDLQIRAFGANPQDPEIAGSLALLYLKLTPPQPDMARQIAMLALTARGPQYRATRMEDWNTFAVASALGGREADAKNALYVMLALAGNVEPTCVAALNALENYGERLRGPVEAVLYRVHAQGRSLESPWCAWPPTGSTPPRVVWPGYSMTR